MKPLPWVAMGLVVLVLTVPVDGYDLIADPVGWLLVGYGAARLDLDAPDRGRLLGAVMLAGVVSLVLWPGPLADRLDDADPSLTWAASLPRIAVAVLLATGLATLARRAGETVAARWLEVSRTLSLIAGVVPVLVFGARLDALDAAAEVISVAAPVVLLVLVLRYSGRPWAVEADTRIRTE